MTTKEFVRKAKVGSRVKVAGKVFTIKEVIKWKMLRSQGFYHKYVLEDEGGDDGYRFAEDPDAGKFLLVHIFKFAHPDSFLPEYEIEGKRFKFSYGEVCAAAEVKGDFCHKVGDLESFWDYEAEDGSYLSLGSVLPSGEREDLIGHWVKPREVKITTAKRLGW